MSYHKPSSHQRSYSSAISSQEGSPNKFESWQTQFTPQVAVPGHRRSNSNPLASKLSNILYNRNRRPSRSRNIFTYNKAKLGTSYRNMLQKQRPTISNQATPMRTPSSTRPASAYNSLKSSPAASAYNSRLQSPAASAQNSQLVTPATSNKPSRAQSPSLPSSNKRPATPPAINRLTPAPDINKIPPKQAIVKLKNDEDEKFIPVSKFAHKSCVGFMPGNANKVNQDSFIEVPQLKMLPEVFLFAVADGHGFYGRDVSTFVKQRFPDILAENENFMVDNELALTEAVAETAKQLKMVEFDINFSGTTFVSVLMTGKRLYCANVGDSRALVARQLADTPNEINPGRHWMSVALSRDHKPDEEDEQERILRKGGRVEAYQDEEGNPLGPARVWLADEDIPGLAMSRSLGDLVAASVGTIFEPEILDYQLTPEDQFLVIGSDGIFEFLPNEDVVRIVVPFYKTGDIQGACDQLVKEAKQTWLQEEEVIDDITCVIVFLNSHNPQIYVLNEFQTKIAEVKKLS